MSLPKYALENPKVIYFFLAVMLIGGIYSFGRLGKKEDAPFVIKTAVVTTRYPGADPQTVEELITEPISRHIQSMSGVHKIKSDSEYGLSKITLELQPSLSAGSIPQKWDELRRKVLDIAPSLPEGASQPAISDDFGDVFGIYYGLTADDGFSLEELRRWAERIKTEVAPLPGVMKVALYGVQTEVVNVDVSLSKLVGLGITPDMLAQLLQSQNQLIGTGQIAAGRQQLLIGFDGTYTSLDDLRNQRLPTPTGEVKLGDIATISLGYQEPPATLMHVDGRPSIGIGIATDPNQDVSRTGSVVEAQLARLQPLMPVGIELITLYPENRIAQEANEGFIQNLILSVVIVVFIIMLVMGIRAGLLIGSSLLFCIGGTLLIMSFLNVGLNRTSLAGFIIAMGMLVDNAIVVTDNAQVAIARGATRRLALIQGATHPQWGLLGATFIAICSFLPLQLAPSSVAEIVKPLFVVLAISLSLSWVLALTQTTTFGHFILKANPSATHTDPYNRPFYRRFATLLGWLMRHRAITLTGVLSLFILSLVVMARMPQDFFPSLDKPYFRADLYFPDGYSIRQVEREVKQIEQYLMSRPQVKHVSATMGSTPLRYYLASTAVGPKPNFANLLVELTDKEFTLQEEEKLNSYLSLQHPDIMPRTMLFKLSPAVEAAIEIGFTGPDTDTLAALTAQAIRLMQADGHLCNIRSSWGNPIPVWTPLYSAAKALPLGITRQHVAQSLRLGTGGIRLTGYRQADQVLPVLLRQPAADTLHLSSLPDLPVFGTGTAPTSLRQVTASFPVRYRYPVIKHLNRQKLMMAQADPRRGQNTTQAFNRLWHQVQQAIQLPPGYVMSYFGQQHSQDESNAALAARLPLTAFLMFATLLLLFRTYLRPVVILLMLPLIFIGVVMGLLVLGRSFNFFAILGLLGLVGMNIKNAIVLMEEIEVQRHEGSPKEAAIIHATISRIVPVSMASGTTILGMLPLLGDAMFGGMAATIMGGLLMASLLTLLVLPVTYHTLIR